MRPLIIGIPTYNRPQVCLALVRQLLAISAKFENLEIIVVDNSEHINAELRDLAAAGDMQKRFSYIKNEENLGFDGSLLKLCRFAGEKQANIWFLCDDDTLYPYRVVSFVEAIKNSDARVKLCQFDFMEEGNTITRCDEVDQWRDADIEDYFRASFLPTLCIDARYLHDSKLSGLRAANYIHLAVVNSIVDSLSDISVFQGSIGSQSPNTVLSFPLRETFIEGFVTCLRYKPIVGLTRIRRETVFRMKGYLSGLIKNVWTGKQAPMRFRNLVGLLSTTYEYLGGGGVVQLSSRIGVLALLSLVKGRHDTD